MKIENIQKNYDVIQKDIDFLNVKIKELQSQQKTLVDQAKQLNYTLKNKKFITDELIYVVDYDLSYYSHFDGYLSEAIEYDFSGSYQLLEEQYNLFKSVIEKYISNNSYKIDDEENCHIMYEQLWDIIPGEAMDRCGFDPQRVLKYMKINDDSIVFEKTGQRDLGTMNPGSTFTITKKPISQFKSFRKHDD